MELQRALIGCQRGGEVPRAMDATTIDDHHDLFARFAKDGHDLMAIWAQLLGVKMRHDLREDPRCAILDGPNDAQQDPAGDTAPGAIASPGLAFERLFPFDVTVAQRMGVQTSALGFAPPAQPGHGKAPQDGFVFIEQNALAPTRPVLQGGKGKRAIGESRLGGAGPPASSPAGGTRCCWLSAWPRCLPRWSSAASS